MNTLVYTVAEIQAMLNISKELAYRFVGKAYQSQDPFIVLKIGTTYRIPKESFDRWITGQDSQIQQNVPKHNMI